MEDNKEHDKKRRERLKHLDDVCKNINGGKWGGENKDACIYLGGEDFKGLERFPSGAKTLDWALGGGWPRGRVCEIYGAPSGGKTSLCLHAIAEFQKKYPEEDVALVDSEYSFSQEYAKNLGVDVDLLILNQPESGEQAMNVIEELIDSGVRMVVVDSVAALTTMAEMEGNYGDSYVSVQARLMSQSLKKLVGKVSRSNSFVLFTNQVREKIGIVWGNKNTTPGGNALKFYASCRVEVVAIGKDKEGDEVVSNRVKATVSKNKTSPPFRIANFVITYGRGVDNIAAVLDDAINCKVIIKKGGWFDYKEERLGQGRASILELLRNNKELLDKINKETEEKHIENGKEEKVVENVEETEEPVKERKAKKLPKLGFEEKENDGEVVVEEN